ncbi:arsenate reductase (glutaredoxin) [Granulibacter bethesdensis]|uniref:arsenate reductase (glutaredoxin) n=1 Tax=Granulibacter bethesdensis TaxID=364410 RepID=UPI0003F1EA78|nr:arsenate reductase (glutaredoxin) [Granulibacter bethesdensis]AHJ64559.1 Arsenate reductase [Granulibacter bethesdensis CGDNIH4]
MTVTIYHNPGCGTSRAVLALIEEAGHQPVVIEYMKTPLTRPTLSGLLHRMNGTAHDLLRRKGPAYEQSGLDRPDLTEEDILTAILAEPALLNRPIVDTPLGVKLCRPAETVMTILPPAPAAESKN